MKRNYRLPKIQITYFNEENVVTDASGVPLDDGTNTLSAGKGNSIVTRVSASGESAASVLELNN